MAAMEQGRIVFDSLLRRLVQVAEQLAHRGHSYRNSDLDTADLQQREVQRSGASGVHTLSRMNRDHGDNRAQHGMDHPSRTLRQRRDPKPKPLPEAVWINPPTTPLSTQEIAL